MKVKQRVIYLHLTQLLSYHGIYSHLISDCLLLVAVVLLSIQLPGTRWDSDQIPDSWPRPGYCGHLETELVDRRSLFPLCICFSNKVIINKVLQLKREQLTRMGSMYYLYQGTQKSHEVFKMQETNQNAHIQMFWIIFTERLTSFYPQEIPTKFDG